MGRFCSGSPLGLCHLTGPAQRPVPANAQLSSHRSPPAWLPAQSEGKRWAPPSSYESCLFQQQAGAKFRDSGVRPGYTSNSQLHGLKGRSPGAPRGSPPPPLPEGQPPPRLRGPAPRTAEKKRCCRVAAKKSCRRERRPSVGDRGTHGDTRHPPHEASLFLGVHHPETPVPAGAPTPQLTHPRRGDCSSRRRAARRRAAPAAPCFLAEG